MFNFNFMGLKLKKKGFECTNILFNAWNFLNIFTPSKIILLWNSWGLGRSPCSRPNCVRFILLALAAPTIRSCAPPSTWHTSWWTFLAPTGTYRWRCFRMVMAPVVVVGFALITPRLTYKWKKINFLKSFLVNEDDFVSSCNPRKILWTIGGTRSARLTQRGHFWCHLRFVNFCSLWSYVCSNMCFNVPSLSCSMSEVRETKDSGVEDPSLLRRHSRSRPSHGGPRPGPPSKSDVDQPGQPLASSGGSLCDWGPGDSSRTKATYTLSQTSVG